MKRKVKPNALALELARRGLQLVCLLLFCAYIYLLYTENTTFQAKLATLHAAREFVSIGASVLLMSTLASIVVQDKSE